MATNGSAAVTAAAEAVSVSQAHFEPLFVSDSVEKLTNN